MTGRPTPATVFSKKGMDADYLVARLKMHPDHRGGCAVVFEGSTDVELFRYFLVAKQVTPVHAGSRQDALHVIERCHAAKIPVLAVIDADNDHVLGRKLSAGGLPVVVTDYRDAEATAFLGSPGDQMLARVLDADKVEELCENSGTSIKDRIVRAAAFAGAARVVNERDRLRLNFKKTPIENYLDRAAVTVNGSEYWDALLGQKWIGGELLEYRDQFDQLLDSDELAALAGGHDLIRILAAVCRGPLGIPQQSSDAASLERSLRIAWSMDFFHTTQMSRHMQEWAALMGLQLLKPVVA